MSDTGIYVSFLELQLQNTFLGLYRDIDASNSFLATTCFLRMSVMLCVWWQWIPIPSLSDC